LKDKAIYKIGIIGGGAWGTALANILAKKEKIILWAKEKSVCDNINKLSENKRYLPKIKLSKKIKCTTSILDVSTCEILFVVSPVQYLSINLLKLKKNIKSLKLPSEIVSSIFPKNKIAIISGPNFATEIAKGLPAATVVSSKSEQVANRVAQLIKSPTLRPYLSDDIIGSQIAGALKNIYAIASGIVFGKKYGENAVASIISRSFAEIKIVAQSMNAKKSTLAGLSGMGDLFLTCSSKESRNFSLGIDLAKGKTLNQIVEKKFSVAEGVFTVRALKKLSIEKKLDLPINDAIYKILYRKKNIDVTIQELLNRPITKE
jgi:glycerol-3-phosphate dehydrogenase (NAD(P)+)